MYKTELHAHCTPVSGCASVPPEELLDLYCAAGYSALVLTNHLSRQAFTPLKGATWKEKLDYFLSPYRILLGSAKGRIVPLLGAEIRNDENENDYLCFGLTPETLYSFPENLFSMRLSEITALAHDIGCMMYQAHPMRFNMHILDPQKTGLDGIEVHNAHCNHDSHNDIAEHWAKRMQITHVTSGSDFHDAWGNIGGGIETEKPILNNADLLKCLSDNAYRLIRG